MWVAYNLQLRPFAACNSHSIKLPCCRIRDALGQDKGLASFKMGILFVCLVPVRVRTGHGKLGKSWNLGI